LAYLLSKAGPFVKSFFELVPSPILGERRAGTARANRFPGPYMAFGWGTGLGVQPVSASGGLWLLRFDQVGFELHGKGLFFVLENIRQPPRVARFENCCVEGA
jgi:hypothetical protein